MERLQRIIVFLVLTMPVLILLNGCNEADYVPAYLTDLKDKFAEDPRGTNLKWFTEARYGMFIHWGLYSLLERGEWVQLRDTIPVAEYAKLQDRFTAENFNPDEITQLALDAGMKYITITSKHHDGFCLFRTGATEFNALNAPAGRDLIGELYEACEEKGLALFLFYSYAADWKHPYFYSRESGWNYARPAYKEPQPEYKFEKDEDFKIYVEYVHTHMEEILTQYPNIAGIWFDPIMGFYHRSNLFPIDATYALVRSLSPHALISFKQGANGDEDFRAPERHGTARVGESLPIAARIYELNKDKPIEICNTLQPRTWGYNRSMDGKHKTAEEVLQLLDEARELDANLLLNIGPKGDGSIPEEDAKTLREVGAILRDRETSPSSH